MQTLVIRLPEGLARRVRSFVDSKGHGYASLNEFMEVALENQLNMEPDRSAKPARNFPRLIAEHKTEYLELERSSESVTREEATLSPLFARPTWQPPAFTEPVYREERLFALTNRLSPVKVAVRILANLVKDGDWPTLEAFHEQSASAARSLGFRLQQQDIEAGRGAADRRWVGYPVGPDERAALSRFVFSFTITFSGGGITGPLAVLGLAAVIGDEVHLTDAGWELAKAPSPLLGEAPGGTVSDEEAQILRQQVRRAREEANAVKEFLSDVRRSAGNQARLDELLALRNPDWTQNLAVAQRSAMLGRLGDLKAVSVSGRGSSAMIQLLPAAQELDAN